MRPHSVASASVAGGAKLACDLTRGWNDHDGSGSAAVGIAGIVARGSRRRNSMIGRSIQFQERFASATVAGISTRNR